MTARERVLALIERHTEATGTIMTDIMSSRVELEVEVSPNQLAALTMQLANNQVVIMAALTDLLGGLED